jgi:hypothetical protein
MASAQSKSLTREDPLDTGDSPAMRTDAARRQRAYRLRRKRAVIDAIGNEPAASRATLLALLAHELAVLEARSAPASAIAPARNSARRVLTEIITRYAIEL